MLSVRRILDLGCDNPMSLSMGHPIGNRVKHLQRTKILRGGGAVTALLIGCGLALTSMAKDNLLSFIDSAPLFTSDKGVTIQGVPFVISYMAAEDLRPVLEYKIQGKYLTQQFKSFGVGLEEESADGFPPMPFMDACIDHVYTENMSPLWYARTGKILKTDATGTPYIITCIPGTSQQRKSLELDDFLKSVNTSKSLSATEKQALTVDLARRGAFPYRGRGRQTSSKDEFVNQIRAATNLSDAKKQEIIKSIQSSGPFIPTTHSRRIGPIYRIDPNLSKEQRQALQERMASEVNVERITFSAGLSDEERETKLEEWRGKLDARMAEKGMIQVEPGTDTDLVEHFED